jgi:hypothetical protein
MLTAGVIHVCVFPSQNSEPDVIPTDPAQPPPGATPPAIAIQVAPLQYRAPTVAAPEQAIPAVGICQVAPLQYKEPETMPYPVHMVPTTAELTAPEFTKVLVVKSHVAPAGVENPAQGPPTQPKV